MSDWISNFIYLLQNSPLLGLWAVLFIGLGFWQTYEKWSPWQKRLARLQGENIALKADLNALQARLESNPESSAQSRVISEEKLTSFDRHNRRRRFGEEPTFGCRACERPEED